MSPFPDPPDGLGRLTPEGRADPTSADAEGRPRPARDDPTPPIIADDEAGGDGVRAAEGPEDDPAPVDDPARGASARRLAGRGRGLERPTEAPPPPLTAEQRLLVLDAWRRSGPPAGDFGPLVNLSKHTLYDWKRRFEAEGPAGLQDKPRGSPRGSRLPEVAKRAILMMKQDNPDWQRKRRKRGHSGLIIGE